MKPQFLISSIGPGNGKTIFAMGLIHALRKRGMKVQPYKCGPEITDTQLLTLSADNEAVNLDEWITTYTHIQHTYNKYGEKADACIIEGNGALFDGYKRMQGSSAEIAKLLNVPVVLLVNARMAGYSIASIIYGFKHFHPQVKIVGVVFNQITSSAHYSYLKEACFDAGVDCLGYLPYNAEFKLPSKHSSITLTTKRTMDTQINLIADDIEKNININRLLMNCNRNFPCQYTLPYSSDIETETVIIPTSQQMKIAIARDPAFNFIYKENIARLSIYGKITYFSPVYGSDLPEADLIYLPGGYPELFARQLHRRHKLKNALKEYAEKGGKILAECGGMAFLGHSITAKEGGTSYEMCNILPLDFTINSKLNSGYRKMTYNGVELRGYEFHYSVTNNAENSLIATQATNIKGTQVDLPLYRYKNIIASYGHWYWGDKDILELWK